MWSGCVIQALFKTMKAVLPGPFTFILPSTNEVSMYLSPLDSLCALGGALLLQPTQTQILGGGMGLCGRKIDPRVVRRVWSAVWWSPRRGKKLESLPSGHHVCVFSLGGGGVASVSFILMVHILSTTCGTTKLNSGSGEREGSSPG